MAKIGLAKRSDGDTKMVLGVSLTLLTLLSGRLAAPLGAVLGLDAQSVTFLRTFIRTVIALVCFIALGGASWLVPNLRKIRDTWRFARPLVLVNLVVSVIMGSWAVFLLLAMGEVTSKQLFDVGYVTILCIFVGINEEVMFRGLMFGGLLAKLGNRKNGPLLAGVISAIAFGFAHVMFDIDYTNPLSITQGLFKTLQTGLVGLVLCVPVLEGRNLVGAMTAHSFFDWIIMIGNAYNGTMPTGTYVNTEQTYAIAAIVIYMIFSALYLPRGIKSLKRLQTLELPQFGPFLPAEKSAAIAVSTNTAGQSGSSKPRGGATPSHMGKRSRRILDKRYATMLATPLVYMAITNITSVIYMLVFGDGMASKVVVAITSVIVSMGLLYVFTKRAFRQFDGVVDWSNQGMLLVLPALALAMMNLLGWPGATFNNPLVCLILAMAPGFSEEILFRAIPLSNWMRLRCDKDGIIESVVATSLGFGLIHGMNILAGASLSSTVFQIVYATCLGALFAAVLLRSGSIWPCIILHTLIDFLSFEVADMNNVGVLTQELEINLEFWLVLALSIGLAAWATWLLRPSKHQEVVDLWKKKWHMR